MCHFFPVSIHSLQWICVFQLYVTRYLNQLLTIYQGVYITYFSHHFPISDLCCRFNIWNYCKTKFYPLKYFLCSVFSLFYNNLISRWIWYWNLTKFIGLDSRANPKIIFLPIRSKLRRITRIGITIPQKLPDSTMACVWIRPKSMVKTWLKHDSS